MIAKVGETVFKIGGTSHLYLSDQLKSWKGRICVLANLLFGALLSSAFQSYLLRAVQVGIVDA
jgi:hypothetical protein